MSSTSSRAPSPNNPFSAATEGTADGAVGPIVATSESCTNSTYSDMAAKTVEKIRKLQENVSGGTGNGGNEKTTIWVGNYQVTGPRFNGLKEIFTKILMNIFTTRETCPNFLC